MIVLLNFVFQRTLWSHWWTALSTIANHHHKNTEEIQNALCILSLDVDTKSKKRDETVNNYVCGKLMKLVTIEEVNEWLKEIKCESRELPQTRSRSEQWTASLIVAPILSTSTRESLSRPAYQCLIEDKGCRGDVALPYCWVYGKTYSKLFYVHVHNHIA